MEDQVGEEKEQYADMDNKRIAAVLEYLTVKKEVASSRLITSAQGSDSPNDAISENDDEDVAQAKNRRVFFIIR
jgi:outer membrane protein OmpA-like peptidoglycan-associated protein